MPPTQRQMRLTPELVARVARVVEDPGDAPPTPGIVWCNDEDRAAAIASAVAAKPDSEGVWVFAYGSLIWKPEFEFVDRRVGVVRGWHRSFCLGWVRRWRGTPEHPGLMMALDRGGDTTGVAFRLPPDAVDASLLRLFRREMRTRPDAMTPTWVAVETGTGTIPALAFVIDPVGNAYVGGVSIERTAEVLADAVGHIGSMADYLYQTVKALEDLGIHDEHLWELQALVAERIEATCPAPSPLAAPPAAR